MASQRHAAQRARRSPPAAESFRLALGLQRQGRARDARRLFDDVLRAEPGHFGALCSLAGMHFEQGSPASGLLLIDQALQVRPDAAEAHHARACFLQALGRLPEAIEAYEAAIALKPSFPEAHSNLGGLYSEQRRYDRARLMYEQALRDQPDFAEAHNNLGVALLALDRADAALEHFAAAVALKPDFADARGNQGSALISLGRVSEASQTFEEAIRLSPRNGRFYLDLAACRRFAADDPQFAAMQALSGDASGLPAGARIELHFALGKAFADIGRFDSSFRHLRQGNALKRVNTVYDEAGALAMMRRVEALFGADLLARRGGIGATSPTPVFVVGMPRSGTTLIEQILASHPKIFAAGERPELLQAATALAGAHGPAAALFEGLASLPDDGLRQLGAKYVDAIAALAPVADGPYGDRPSGGRPAAERIVDKMPGNFLLLGVIALALPNARVIHVHRDPADTCLSCFSTLFSSEQPYAYNLSELGRYYSGYAALMRHWRAALPREFMLEVRYEDVVDDLEGQARRMIAHCGLDWDARCLEFHRTPRTVQTASKAQVRQKLYRSSVGRAQAYGPMLAPLVQALEAPR